MTTILIQNEEKEERERKMLSLLKRAADSLQEYCAEVNGDMNDSLAMEIYELIEN